MLTNFCTSRRTLYVLLFVLIFFLVTVSNPKNLNAQDLKNKKAIIFVVDNLSLNELVESDTPNFHSLMERGGLAQMNIRAKSSLSNRGSTYLSLALGVRTLASTKGGLAYDRNELVHLDDATSKSQMSAQQLYQLFTGKKRVGGQVVNLAIADTKRAASSVSSSYLSGLFGQKAKEFGLTVGVVGNSDTSIPKRESTMLAMDEEGKIPYGSVGSHLLKEDTEVLGGVRLDERTLLQEVEKILPKVDVLFIDYGDTVRVQDNYLLASDKVKLDQKLKALQRADAFLGLLISKTDLSNTLFMVISPNPSREAVQSGNFGLTPIIVAGPKTKQGLLTSSTTRRSGLVTNFDFAPTVLQFFEKSNFGNYLGEPMEVIQYSKPTEKLLQDQNLYLGLRKYRSTFHWTYIALATAVLVLLFNPFNLLKRDLNDSFSKVSLLVILALPISIMTVSLFGYISIIFDLVYIMGGALIVAIIVKKTFNHLLLGIGILSLVTTLLLLTDVFWGANLMMRSPLGSDPIAGGRFYGIGNDYMGVLLSSSILGLFSLFEYFKANRTFMTVTTVLLLIGVVFALSPVYGANVGGTLSALVITILAMLTIYDKSISIHWILGIIGGVILVVFGLSLLDAALNPSPTHAGKAIDSLILGGWERASEIISGKLGQVGWNLINANWNIVLLLEIGYLVWLISFKREYLKQVKAILPRLSKGFIIIFFGAVVVFMFNDTGTIASAIMLIYLVFPLVISEKFFIDN